MNINDVPLLRSTSSDISLVLLRKRNTASWPLCILRACIRPVSSHLTMHSSSQVDFVRACALDRMNQHSSPQIVLRNTQHQNTTTRLNMKRAPWLRKAVQPQLCICDLLKAAVIETETLTSCAYRVFLAPTQRAVG